MVWVYVEDVDRFVDSVTWATYSQVFEYVWSASAFKGAFGERMFSVNIQRHAANQVTKIGFKTIHLKQRKIYFKASIWENRLSKGFSNFFFPDEPHNCF
jgi:hypothetical protein